MARPIKWNKRRLLRIGNKLVKWLEQSDENIFFYSFCMEEKIPIDVLQDYLHIEEFDRLVHKAKCIQEMKLLKGGLDGTYPIKSVIFLLKVHFGYK